MPTAKPSFRIAQIGMSHAHAAGKVTAMQRRPDVDFVGVFEQDDEVWEATSKSRPYEGVKRLSQQDVLADPAVDGVFVETNPLENLSWAKRVVAEGKHVLIDKPPAPSIEDFREVFSVAERKGLHVQLGYQFRFAPGFEALLDWVNSGRLGHIFSVRAHIQTNQSVYARWYPYVSRFPRGVLFEHCCHMFDLVVAILGKPTNILPVFHADYVEFERRPFVDNTVTVLEFDQALAIVEATVPNVDATRLRHFSVHGTKGAIVLEPMEPPRLRACATEASPGVEKGWQEVEVVDTPRYGGDIDEFVSVARGERKPRYSMAHDLLVHETLLQACGVPVSTKTATTP